MHRVCTAMHGVRTARHRVHRMSGETFLGKCLGNPTKTCQKVSHTWYPPAKNAFAKLKGSPDTRCTQCMQRVAGVPHIFSEGAGIKWELGAVFQTRPGWAYACVIMTTGVKKSAPNNR